MGLLTRLHFEGLWRNPDFLYLWTGQSISLLGSQVTALALPLTAVLVLNATPLEMGILGAVQYAPFAIFSLVAGVWADRLPRRPILIASDIGRAMFLGLIPVAAVLGVLRLEHLYLVGFLTGVLTVFFNVAYTSLLPTLVRTEQLVEADAKLQVTASSASIVGPGLGGAIVQVLSAPIAVVLDVLSFLVSAASLGLIRAPEKVSSANARRDLLREMREGLETVFRDRVLRALIATAVTGNFFVHVHLAGRVLYATDELGIEPALLGIVFSLGSIGGLPAALVAAHLARRFGIGPTVLGAQLLAGIGALLIPLASHTLVMAVTLLVAGMVVWGMSVMIYNINAVSLRQANTPDRLQGRVSGTITTLAWGVGPFGALTGGLLGEVVGLRASLFIAGFGVLFASLWLVLSPVRALRERVALPATSM